MRNQGVTIALIIFIILTLILGSVSYFLGQKYSETTQALKAKEEETQKLTTANSKQAKDFDALKEKAGFDAYESSDVDKILEEMTVDIQKALANRTDLPMTYKSALEELIANLAAKNAELSDCEAKRDEYEQKMNEEIAKSETLKQEYDKQRQEMKANFDSELAKQKEHTGTIENQYADLTKDLDTKRKAADDAIAEANQKEADSKEAVDRIAEINSGLQTQVDQMSKLLGTTPSELSPELRDYLNAKVRMDFEVPNGKVLYVDQENKTLRLDIGESEGVRVLTAFGVFPHDTLDIGGAFPKGSIEVVRVTGKHECIAKILDDEMTNPIMPGDLIYTPLWTTGETRKYALDYQLDIDNDGKSDLDTLMNLIHSSGAEVVAWIDNEGEVHGKIQPDITAFVTSGTNDFYDKLDNNFTIDQETKDKIRSAHNDFMADAKSSNVYEMKLPEFLRRVSYKNTADVTRFQEENAVTPHATSSNIPPVSSGPIAPIFIPEQQPKVPSSSGVTAPAYKSTQHDAVPTSSGKVSDMYFRKRTPAQ